MPGFDFNNANFNLTSINNYLEHEGISLSQDDKQKLNTIFQDSDTYDNTEEKEGKDGVLNNEEWDNFIKNIENTIPTVLDKIKNFGIQLIDNILEKDVDEKRKADLEKLGSRDATYVATKENADNLSKEETELNLAKAEIVSKLSDRWRKAFPKSNVNEQFYNKLYDTLNTLNCTIPDEEFNSEKYSCKEEQAMDEICAIFAGEAQLNTKTVGYVGRIATFYGLFQLSPDGLKAAKSYAAKHPEVSGMNTIKSNMTLDKFKNLSAETQLDYLVAYIGASREASKIDENETISPSKLWSMIKLPNLNEDVASKKARRNKITMLKQNSIIKIIKSADNKC